MDSWNCGWNWNSSASTIGCAFGLAGSRSAFTWSARACSSDLQHAIDLVDVHLGRTVLLRVEQRESVVRRVEDDQLGQVRDEVVSFAGVKQRHAPGQFLRFPRGDGFDPRVDVEILCDGREAKERGSENRAVHIARASVRCHGCLSFWLDASQE